MRSKRAAIHVNSLYPVDSAAAEFHRVGLRQQRRVDSSPTKPASQFRRAVVQGHCVESTVDEGVNELQGMPELPSSAEEGWPSDQ